MSESESKHTDQLKTNIVTETSGSGNENSQKINTEQVIPVNPQQQAETDISPPLLGSSTSNDSVDSSKKIKRSFSSYLSSINQKKQELAEQEEKKKEELEAKQKEEVERLETEAKEKEAIEIQEKERISKEIQDNAEREKELKIQQEKEERERQERERLYHEQKNKLEKLENERKKHETIESLKPEAIVQTIQRPTISRASSALSDLPDIKPSSETHDISASIQKNVTNVTHSDIENEKSDIDSETETVYAISPSKPRRGRLIKKSELDKKKTKYQSEYKNGQHLNDDDDDDDDDEEEEDEDDDDDDLENEDPNDDDDNHKQSNSSTKITTLRQHLLTTSRSVSPTQKGRAHQKPKKRTGRDSSGRLKLQRVCEKGKFDEAKSLIENGADVNDQDYAGNTALHEASLNGHSELVKLLIDNGAEVDLQSGPDDLDTPLIDAASNGHVSVVDILLQYGADPRVENAHGQNALDSIDEDLEESETLKVLLKKAAKALLKKEHEAKSRGVSRNQSEEETDNEDRRSRSRSKNRSQTRNNVSGSSRKDLIFVDFTSKSGRDEVYQRASDGDSQYVGTYLGNGGKPDSEAMALAAKYGHLDVVSLFLGFGAKVDVANKLGMTALMRTVGRGHLEIVKLLIENGADPLRKSKDGKNSFDYAKDALIFDSDEVEYVKAAIENRTGQKLQDVIPEDLNKEDPPHFEEVNQSEIKVKKRKISTNDTQQQQTLTSHQPELKKKKLSPQDVKIELPKKELLRTESISKTDEKVKKPTGEKTNSSSNLAHLSNPSVQPVVQRKISQPVAESEEEKKIRIQKEKEQQKLREKYQSEIAEKQQRRQEKFLSQFESQELKKQEELKKLVELEEERRVKQEESTKQKEKEEAERREMMNKEEERERRLKIRADYPYALRTATFNNNRTKEEAVQYLPLYSWRIDGVDYVIDTQIILTLGFENFITKYSELYKDGNNKLLTVEDKSKVYNIIYPVLRDNSLEARRKSYRERVALLHIEFKKFTNIPVNFIKLEQVLEIVEKDYTHLKDVISSRITKCSYDDIPNESLLQSLKPNATNFISTKITDSRKQVQQMEAEIASQLGKELPHSLRYRPTVIKALVRNRRLW